MAYLRLTVKRYLRDAATIWETIDHRGNAGAKKEQTKRGIEKRANRMYLKKKSDTRSVWHKRVP